MYKLVLEALERNGKDGTLKWLQRLSRDHPAVYAALFAKAMEIDAKKMDKEAAFKVVTQPVTEIKILPFTSQMPLHKDQ
ncbi:hypothetical protein V4P56_00410 [Bartonella sp. B35(2025)]